MKASNHGSGKGLEKSILGLQKLQNVSANFGTPPSSARRSKATESPKPKRATNYCVCFTGVDPGFLKRGSQGKMEGTPLPFPPQLAVTFIYS